LIENREQIALFVDLENFAGFNLALGLPMDLSTTIKKLTEHGRIVIRRSFGDIYKIPIADREKQKLRLMLQNNLVQHEDVRYVNSYKNSSDIRLVIEALSVAYTNPTIDTFAIVADDRDFVPLFNKLREIGKNVIGIGGSKDNTREFYTSACDRFYYHANLTGVNKKAPAESQDLDQFAQQYQNINGENDEQESLKAEAALLLIEAIKAVEGGGKEALGARISPMLKHMKPDFDYRDFGFNSLKDLVQFAEQHNLVKVNGSQGLDFVLQCNDDEIERALSSGTNPVAENADNPLAEDYRNFTETKTKAEILAFAERQQVYVKVAELVQQAAEGITQSELSRQVADQLGFPQKWQSSVYKLLYGLYRSRSFRCGYSAQQYNPLILALATDVSELEQRFVANTMQVFHRENRSTPFDADSWSEVFYGDNEKAEQLSDIFDES